MKDIICFLYHQGSKRRLVSIFNELFPKDIDTFYDIFGGSATTLINISAKKYVYNEINFGIYLTVKWYFSTNPKDILDKYNYVDKEFDLKSKSGFINYINYMNENGVEPFTYWITQNNCYLGGARWNFKKNTISATMPSKKDSQDDLRSTNISIPVIPQHILDNTIFLNDDALNILENTTFNKNDFIYLDPPYSNTKANYNSSWNNSHDERLIKILDKLNFQGIRWALSGVFEGTNGESNNLWHTFSNRYITHEFPITYSLTKRDATEFLITNFKSTRNQLSIFDLGGK